MYIGAQRGLYFVGDAGGRKFTGSQRVAGFLERVLEVGSAPLFLLNRPGKDCGPRRGP